MGIAGRWDIYMMVYITRFPMQARKDNGKQLQIFGSNRYS